MEKILLKSNRVGGSERQQPEKHLVIRIKLLYNEKDWKKYTRGQQPEYKIWRKLC